jgi:hypothetical protein
MMLSLMLAVSLRSAAQGALSNLPDYSQFQTLDSVVAVVNSQVILASDLDLEMRVARLLPVGDPSDASPTAALQRLITRALIEQQIQQEDPQALQVTRQDLDDSLNELRQNLPACKHRDCDTQAGWAGYLASMGLTADRFDDYWSRRIAVLRFIEQRFRSGIRITPEEIEKYYRLTLVPHYDSAQEAPALDKVAPRIQEILLEQQVNALLDDWLKSLQSQGQVEILVPSLRGAAPATDSSPPLPSSPDPALPARSLPGVAAPRGSPSTNMRATNPPDMRGGL